MQDIGAKSVPDLIDTASEWLEAVASRLHFSSCRQIDLLLKMQVSSMDTALILEQRASLKLGCHHGLTLTLL